MQVSLLQRPTLTSGTAKDQAHVKILHPDLYVYNGYDDLKDIMLSFTLHNVMKVDFARHYRPYSPSKVMKEFNNKFLDGKLIERRNAPKVGQKFNFDDVVRQRSESLMLPPKLLPPT